MATEYLLDARPFFEIFHTLLRHDELDYDAEQTRLTVEWVRENSSMLFRVLGDDEARILRTYYDYWMKHKVAPDRQIMEDLIRLQQKNESVIQHLQEYDRHAEDLEVRTHLDLDIFLDKRKLDEEKRRLHRLFNSALSITVGAIPFRDEKTKREVIYQGPRDALRYFNERLSRGILLDHIKSVGGDTVVEGVGPVSKMIEKAAMGYHGGFPTKTPIDHAMDIGPTAPIRYLGVLGFTNHRKSTLVFTLAYQAATQGHKVLIVPRECSVEEAWTKIYWLHAAATGRAQDLPPLAKVRDKRFVKKEHRKVIEELAADMKKRGIRIEVEKLNTFADVKQCAEAHFDDPFDMLVVDYIGHLDTPGYKDSREGVREIFRAAQLLSQSYNEERGLVVMTPVQANKDSQKVVAAGESVLDKGIYTDIGAIEYYTDAGRDMDAVIGVWSGDELREHNLARISCVKSRQQFFKPFYMEIDDHTQMMRYVEDQEAVNQIGDEAMAKQTTAVQPKQISERHRVMSEEMRGLEDLD